MIAKPFQQFFPRLSPHARALAGAQVATVSPELTGGDWAQIAEQAGFECEVALCPDPLLYERPKRHQPRRRSTAATSKRAARRVAFESFDPLKQIPPDVYVEALTGEEVPRNGFIRCPLPDHDERTASFQVLSSHWRCFGCGRGGGIIELAAALYGLRPRGAGYHEIRRRVAAALGFEVTR